MDPNFIEGISDIQDTEDIVASRTTGVYSPRANVNFTYQSPVLTNHGFEESLLGEEHVEEEFQFYSCRQYIQRTLATWGLAIGNLHETEENKKTLQCLMELIRQKHKEQESREKLKSKLAEAEFEKKKYQSLLEQAKHNNDEKNKKIGKMENNFEELKSKLKRLEQQSKKQKDEDKKSIAMLKSKNEQILHEVKKKQQEVFRVKQQMKKNVGEKNSLKTVNFQVYQIPNRVTSDETDDKVNIIVERFQVERKNLVKENLLLKQKLFDIRNEIVSFAEWIDANVFGECNSNYQNKLLVNHNLLFKKESLVDQFNEILEDAKNGIKEVMEKRFGQLAVSQDISESPTKKQQERKLVKSPESKLISMGSSQRLAKTDVLKRQSLAFNKKSPPAQDLAPIKQKVSQSKRPTPTPTQPTISAAEQRSPKATPKKVVPIEEDLEMSMISHISMNDMGGNNKKFDKWDMLFNEEDGDV